MWPFPGLKSTEVPGEEESQPQLNQQIDNPACRQPNHVGRRGFKLMRGKQCLDKWNLIPVDTDVLITHGPPLGHGDFTIFRQRAGCAELLRTVQTRVLPKLHVFGHIHEGKCVNGSWRKVFRCHFQDMALASMGKPCLLTRPSVTVSIGLRIQRLFLMLPFHEVFTNELLNSLFDYYTTFGRMRFQIVES